MTKSLSTIALIIAGAIFVGLPTGLAIIRIVSATLDHLYGRIPL